MSCGGARSEVPRYKSGLPQDYFLFICLVPDKPTHGFLIRGLLAKNLLGMTCLMTRLDVTYAQPNEKAGLTKMAKPASRAGGDDEARTRDLRRDRPAF